MGNRCWHIPWFEPCFSCIENFWRPPKKCLASPKVKICTKCKIPNKILSKCVSFLKLLVKKHKVMKSLTSKDFRQQFIFKQCFELLTIICRRLNILILHRHPQKALSQEKPCQVKNEAVGKEKVGSVHSELEKHSESADLRQAARECVRQQSNLSSKHGTTLHYVGISQNVTNI